MSLQAPVSNPAASIKYTIEQCASCSGSGHKCTACDGNGLVLVRMPASKCTHCKGTGVERNIPASGRRLCALCAGTGWELVVRKSA